MFEESGHDESVSGDDESVVRRDRFSGGPARSFLSSLEADRRIFAADLAVDRAHVVMLAEQGAIDDETAGAILTALDAIEVDGHDSLPDGEDVHEAIETAVIDRVGEDGGKMHTARSRNDEVATCLRYRLREDVLSAIETTLALRESLLAVAEEHDETIMPGYTHLQPAQPTTVAHWALSYEGAVRRDTARLLEAYDRVNESPLGGAAFAGTTFEIDRERTAELLGFDGVVENSMDAASSRDFLLETVQALSTHATTLSGLAEDVIVFANRGFVSLSDDYSSTSSIMPQKKNPDTLELVRAVAGDAAGTVQGLTTTLKGLPRAYNRDLQRATTHAWETVDAVTEASGVTAGAVATAEWNEETLAAEAGEGFSTATGVADLLAANGLPFRTAHEMVAVAAENGGDYDALEAAAETVLGEPLESYVDPVAVTDALDPAESVASRDSQGGPAPEAVADQLEAVREAVENDETELTERDDTLEKAHVQLRAEVTEYV
ncbi:argininosuccinate lyase [Natronobacterium gregoryi]|uniref:Argininosuccinate lyase n=2 Tax=Natronobacterium gregoryi TaxID=44930 RepID=L0AIB9_NATGS|nr:argininosuccinate lyase [Natronobacterium gregoryi]AFZ72815.1 argininosuccinate lyase [Natronobacterium gregoryi SP2]ELY69421.1 argininosuccinate lyase [Natronobacterium gregoryi SP2]PLK21155.1 argininosuccinate lyase [Natronobacterium gregoryi SP2]SFJ10103.1 argininosuccinate lyase [Natronobacterium gregoryi]